MGHIAGINLTVIKTLTDEIEHVEATIEEKYTIRQV